MKFGHAQSARPERTEPAVRQFQWEPRDFGQMEMRQEDGWLMRTLND